MPKLVAFFVTFFYTVPALNDHRPAYLAQKCLDSAYWAQAMYPNNTGYILRVVRGKYYEKHDCLKDS